MPLSEKNRVTFGALFGPCAQSAGGPAMLQQVFFKTKSVACALNPKNVEYVARILEFFHSNINSLSY